MHQNYFLFYIHYVNTSIYLVIQTRKGILPRSLFHTQHLFYVSQVMLFRFILLYYTPFLLPDLGPHHGLLGLLRQLQ